jgi:hypothetical protein
MARRWPVLRWLISVALVPVAFGSIDEAPVEKLRTQVTKIGRSEQTCVKVRLQSGGQLRGCITAADHEAFTVIDRKTGGAVRLTYEAVAAVKQDRGFPTARRVVEVTAAVGVIVLLLGAAGCLE